MSFVILVGLLLAIWGHTNIDVRWEEYSQLKVNIENAEFRESEQDLKLYTDRGNYVLPKPNIPYKEINVVRHEGPKLRGPANIWLRSENHVVVTGIDSSNLDISPILIAELERDSYRRYRNVGIVLSTLGILIICSIVLHRLLWRD